MSKIHVTGGPSAGKTTLAAVLGNQMGIPVFALDEIAYVDERWTSRPPVERARMVARILANEKWITEGGQLGWTRDILESADVIIWLDPPLAAMLWRHFQRHRSRGITWLLGRWMFQARYYFSRQPSAKHDEEVKISRAATVAALRPFVSKVHQVRHGYGVALPQ